MSEALCLWALAAIFAGLIVIGLMAYSSDVELVEADDEPLGEQVDIRQFYQRREDRL